MTNVAKIASRTFTVDESLRKMREIAPTDAIFNSLIKEQGTLHLTILQEINIEKNSSETHSLVEYNLHKFDKDYWKTINFLLIKQSTKQSP